MTRQVLNKENLNFFHTEMRTIKREVNLKLTNDIRCLFYFLFFNKSETARAFSEEGVIEALFWVCIDS